MLLRHDVDMDEGATRADQVDALGPQRRDPHSDLAHHLSLAPAGLLQQQIPLVVVGEQIRRAVDELANLLTGQPGQLLRRVGGECQAELAALLGVQEHRLGVVCADDHQFRCADPLHDVSQGDVARLGHGTGIEGRDLCHGLVGRAHESRGVRSLGDEHAVCVHAYRLEPCAVVVEVPAHSADQCDIPAQNADCEGHVARDAAAMHDQIVDQETQRHLLKMLGQKLFGEFPGEPHQMVGRN